MTTPTQAAYDEAHNRAREVTGYCEALAIALQEMSDVLKDKGLDGPNCGLSPFILPDPVDPLLIEAREIAAQDPIWMADGTPAEIRQGHRDDFSQVRVALAALRRGMELAQVQP